MRIVPNAGTDRVIDSLTPWLQAGAKIDVVTPELSLFAFAELRDQLQHLAGARVILPDAAADLRLTGSAADRGARNQLRTHWLAGQLAEWVEKRAQVLAARTAVAQGGVIARDEAGEPKHAILGATPFTTDGLGVTPGNPLSLIQATEDPNESVALARWFDAQWTGIGAGDSDRARLLAVLREMANHRAPSLVYALVLHHLFASRGEDLDEERIVRSATGIRDTVVWKKLYRFQRDGVVGALDKLDRYGGCIIADSVGLGKTFEALAIIKYHELRNDRVLVLCPKRLRDNWTIYKANDRRNFLAPDRFNYDVLNHTDLSRDGGTSGDIDLAHVNWGNYDLVVIDESHNFRNKLTPKAGGETRYDRLMRQIIQEGVRTRVLMLSATPVNNRLADLRNQIAFVTEGDDTAFIGHGIPSIEATTRLAQRQFNRWLDLDDSEKTPINLIEMLGFDYFTLLDLVTIARSRKHIERYYGTIETGRVP